MLFFGEIAAGEPHAVGAALLEDGDVEAGPEVAAEHRALRGFHPSGGRLGRRSFLLSGSGIVATGEDSEQREGKKSDEAMELTASLVVIRWASLGIFPAESAVGDIQTLKAPRNHGSSWIALIHSSTESASSIPIHSLPV